MKPSFSFKTASLLCAVLLVGCSSPIEYWNQKLTIVLASEERELVLSEVRKIKFEYTDPDSATASLGLGSKAVITGEAVFAALPDGRLFLALLKGVGRRGDEGYNALFTGPKEIRGAKYDERVIWWRSVEYGASFNLDQAGWPYMVTGRVADGKLVDVAQVDPENPYLLGTSFYVKSVTLEKTKEEPDEFDLPDLLTCLKVLLGDCGEYKLGPDITDPGLYKFFLADNYPQKPADKGLWE